MSEQQTTRTETWAQMQARLDGDTIEDVCAHCHGAATLGVLVDRSGGLGIGVWKIRHHSGCPKLVWTSESGANNGVVWARFGDYELIHDTNGERLLEVHLSAEEGTK